MAIHWENYVACLKNAHVRIVDREDEMVWKHSPNSSYTPNLGYIQLNIISHQQEYAWWWKGLWKLKFCPQKNKIMWCVIVNNIPTWDKMKNRKIEGSGWCSLWKNNEESLVCLFIECPFVKKVRLHCSQALEWWCFWKGTTIVEAQKLWFQNPSYKSIKSLPLIVTWGVWLVRNASFFHEKSSLLEIIATQGLNILSHFP